MQVKKLKIMSLKMVANQVEGLKAMTKAKDCLVQLELSEDGKNVANLHEWDEALREVLTSAGLEFYLTPHSGLEVNRAENPRIMVQHRADACKTAKTKALKKEASKAKKEQDAEEELRRAIEEELAKRKEEMLRAMTADNALSEKRGIRPVTYFVEYLTGVEVGAKSFFPQNKYEVMFEGKKLWCDLESPDSRSARQNAWQLIIHSVSGKKGIHKSFWSHVHVNNVHELYKLVMSHFADNDRRNVAASLNERVRGLVKERDELFAAFVGRFRQLGNECKEVKLTIDPDVMFGYAVNAILNSEDERVKKVYGDALCLHGDKMTTPDELFDVMMPTMKMHEKIEREQAGKFEEKKKKKNKKEREGEKSKRAS